MISQHMYFCIQPVKLMFNIFEFVVDRAVSFAQGVTTLRMMCVEFSDCRDLSWISMRGSARSHKE